MFVNAEAALTAELRSLLARCQQAHVMAKLRWVAIAFARRDAERESRPEALDFAAVSDLSWK